MIDRNSAQTQIVNFVMGSTRKEAMLNQILNCVHDTDIENIYGEILGGEPPQCNEDDLVTPDCDQLEEDAGPAEGDLVTPDRISFYGVGGSWSEAFYRAAKPAIRVPPGGPWQPAVQDYMDRDQFFPDVWEWSPDTGYTRITQEMDEEDE